MDIVTKIIERSKNNLPLLTKEELDTFDRKQMIEISSMFTREHFDISLNLQFFYYEKRERNTEQKIQEIYEEIQEFEIKYGGDFHSVFGHLSDLEADGINEAIDYSDWKQLILNLKHMLRNTPKPGVGSHEEMFSEPMGDEII